LDNDGVAHVKSFPAVPAGECIASNDWPSDILRDGDATWMMGKDTSIRIIGDGWAADLQYVWHRGSPDFYEVRYPTCAADGDYPYFILRSY
jgi:hypothetical protein